MSCRPVNCDTVRGMTTAGVYDIYTRLSRAAEEETSTTRQGEAAQQLAAMRGWEVRHVYTDSDYSAFTGKARPGFEELLDAIERGEIGGVIFWKLDRLVRNHFDFERLWALCEPRGVQLVSVTEPIDSSTEIGMIVIRLLVSFARLESVNISLRVTDAHRHAARNGKPHPSGRRPFGLTGDWQQVVPLEAEAVRDGAEMILAGKSAGEVARDWNGRGLLSPTGKPWRSSTVTQCLRSPRVAAKRIYKGEVVGDGHWPAVLDADVWEQTVAVLDDPARSTGGGGPAKHLLSGGLLRCECGRPMSMRPQRGTRRYICRKDIGGCGSTSIVADALEEWVVEMMFTAVGEGLQRLPVRDDTSAAALQTIRDGEAQLEQYAKDHAQGLIGRAEWLAARDVVAGRVEKARRALSRRRVPDVLRFGREALEAEWSRRDTGWRRWVLNSVYDRVVVHPARGGGVFRPERVTPTWRI